MRAEESVTGQLVSALPPRMRPYVVGAVGAAVLLGSLGAWLDRRIDQHVQPIATAVEAVGADVRDLSRSVQAEQKATDARLDSNDVRYAGLSATVQGLAAHIDAADAESNYAGRRR